MQKVLIFGVLVVHIGLADTLSSLWLPVLKINPGSECSYKLMLLIWIVPCAVLYIFYGKILSVGLRAKKRANIVLFIVLAEILELIRIHPAEGMAVDNVIYTRLVYALLPFLVLLFWKKGQSRNLVK